MNTVHQEDQGGDVGRALEELRGRLAGSVIEPQDPLYDEARAVWNGMIDVRPRAVIRAGAVGDIDPVLHTARRTGLPLAVRGGGHNIAGHGTVDDGLVLDLGQLRGVEVDVERRLVTVEPGATLADVDRATTAHGLAVPLGVISATGVAGLTLGGGVGWLTRSNGLSLDNLASADVVTATGEHLHASDQENPELFWGLRGGGGNFGVVSSFTFRARPLPDAVLGGNFFYRPPRWKSALGALDRWTQDLPDEMNPIISFLVLPPDLEMGDEPWMIIGFAWASEDHQPGLELIEQLRAAARNGGNIMPASIAAAKAGVTTGEWAEEMRKTYGTYRGPTGVSASVSNKTEGLEELRDAVNAVSDQLGRRLKFVVGKPGLDGHSNGAEQIAFRARDCGMDITYDGIRMTPEELVAQAQDDQAHVVGLSILSGSHLPLVQDLMQRMEDANLGHIPVVVGGIIPDEDAQKLHAMGVSRVYTPKDFELNTIMGDIIKLAEHS